MKKTYLSMPELAFIAGTRAALGAGAALILSDRLDRKQKKAIGWTLFLVGVATTAPIMAIAIGRRRG
ncbi:MAG: hypothetical protein PHR66_05320 [Desulfuromonadaceae bacterium]|nr:hypothetical protein [Desulfuromonadaceae bacterium]